MSQYEISQSLWQNNIPKFMSQGLLVSSIASDSRYKDLISGVLHTGVSTDRCLVLHNKGDAFCFKVLQKGLIFETVFEYSCWKVILGSFDRRGAEEEECRTEWEGPGYNLPSERSKMRIIIVPLFAIICHLVYLLHLFCVSYI